MVQLSAKHLHSKRREILEAAAATFREMGLRKSSMRTIAARLNVAVGQLYYYFESKDELLAWCHRSSLSCLLRMADHVEAAAESRLEQLCGLVFGHLSCLHDWFPGSMAHIDVPTEALDGPLRPMRDAYQQRLVACLEEGQKRGEFSCHDPKLSALLLLGSMNWSTRWYRPNGKWGLDDLASEILRPTFLGAGVSLDPMPSVHRVAEWFRTFKPQEWTDE